MNREWKEMCAETKKTFMEVIWILYNQLMSRVAMKSSSGARVSIGVHLRGVTWYKCGNAFSYILVNISDEAQEMYSHRPTQSQFPFSVDELVKMSASLRDVCVGLVELAHPDTRMSAVTDTSYTSMWAHCFKVGFGGLFLSIRVVTFLHYYNLSFARVYYFTVHL